MKIFVLIILFSGYMFGQINTDSIYNAYVELKTGSRISKATDEKEIEKCGFVLSGKIKTYFDSFTPAQQQVLNKLMQRPEKTKTINSPRNLFKVHYNETGDNPKYNLNQLLNSLDSVYLFEVIQLGFTPPPSDNGMGGDELYDVYISDLGSAGRGLYGFTEFESSLGGNKYTSFMVIDDDYDGFYSEGILGAQVTVAHEFHHAIQIGSYIYRDADAYFYELTSTSMEEFMYDHINDYYAYIDEFFVNPSRAFYEFTGYDEVLWNIYLYEKFKSLDFVKKQWELMPQMTAINAVENSLADYNTNFRHEYNEFGVWSFFTNYRSVSGKYFEEARGYGPPLQVLSSLTFSNSQISVDMNVDPASNTFVSFISTSKQDTLVSVITNGDVSQAAADTLFNFAYNLSKDTLPGYIKLSDGYFNSFEADNVGFWALSEILNSRVVRMDSSSFNPVPVSGKIEFAFPNPFYYKRNYDFGTYINIGVPYNETEQVDLNIYTSSMDLVYSENLHLSLFYTDSKNYVVRWNALDNKNRKLNSGVYIYVVKSGDNTTKGKLVIFND